MLTVGGVLFDIDGVLVRSWKPIPGAVDALKVLADKQIGRSFLTNTTSITRAGIAAKLEEAGFDVHADEVLTAAVLTGEYVRSQYPDAKVALLNSGSARIVGDMPGIDFVDFDDPSADPDVVVVGGAGESFTHERLSRLYAWLVAGVPVVAMHRSFGWATDAGTRIDTGMYLAGMQEASGRSIVAVGKPSPQGFTAAAVRIGADPESIVMIGDDLVVDVLAAQVVGMTGVLVRTGKFSASALARRERDEFADQPRHVVDSVADLPGLLGL